NLFRRHNSKEPSESETATSSTGASEGQVQISSVKQDYGDREHTWNRYKEASNILRQSIRSHEGSWGSFELDLGEPEDTNDPEFRSELQKILAAREGAIKDKSSWSKFGDTIECIFASISPFAKNFLTIAKEAQSVFPSLFHFCMNLLTD